MRHNSKNHGETSYEESVAKSQGGHEHHHDGLPDYILEGSDEEVKWRVDHPHAAQKQGNGFDANGITKAHTAAATGDINSIINITNEEKHLVTKKDFNGWAPIHEASRGGHVEIVKHLINNGADVNEITGLEGGDGKSALYLAIEEHGEEHPLVHFLQSINALAIGPEL